jgi:hypothetical protein
MPPPTLSQLAERIDSVSKEVVASRQEIAELKDALFKWALGIIGSIILAAFVAVVLR